MAATFAEQQKKEGNENAGTMGGFFSNIMNPKYQNDLPLDREGKEGTDMFIQEDRYLQAYATYFSKFIDAYRIEGIDIFGVMPQNEFNSAQVFPSCCWTAAGLANFIGKYLGPAMQEQGVEVIFGTMERRTVPPTYGSQSPYANMGETKNHGIDAELKWNSKIGQHFNYFVKVNLSLSESRIIEKDDPPATPIQQQDEGKPIGWQSGLISTGLYQTWNAVYNSTISSYSSNLIPGSLSYVDYNGDGIIDVFDMVPIADPSYATKTYAFSLGFNWKGFGVHAMFNGMFDISKYISDLYLFEYTGHHPLGFQLLNNEQLDAWTPTNTDGEHPALHLSSNNHDKQRSTYNVRSSAFLRLKTLEVKYKIGKRLQDKIGLFESFEVYVNGNNLATWSDLPDEFDPEQSQLEVYPITKRYNLGLRVSF
ncbi:hypothetical protein [Mangrovibacterium sp.]|uniref:hypothetical protein n=1 Tax=Mangrovibacterium sp. TaxID=1961364 RepID=UPI00356B2E56